LKRIIDLHLLIKTHETYPNYLIYPAPI